MTVPYVTYADLQEWQRLDDKIRSLRRQASDLAKLQGELEETKLIPFCREHGGDELSCVRSGYRLTITSKPGPVSWKTEFIKAVSEWAAEALIKAAPPKEEFSVVKVE